MAYGRVNVLSQGGVGCLDNLKTIDMGDIGKNKLVYVDFVRQRKYENSTLLDFNDNVITSFDNHRVIKWHIGFIELENLSTREYGLYDIVTGNQVDFPEGFRRGHDEIDFILNKDMDYITEDYIKRSDGSIKHRLQETYSQVRLIHRDVVYFANHRNSGFYTHMYALYKYENRELTKLQGDYMNVQTTNFL